MCPGLHPGYAIAADNGFCEMGWAALRFSRDIHRSAYGQPLHIGAAPKASRLKPLLQVYPSVGTASAAMALSSATTGLPRYFHAQ